MCILAVGHHLGPPFSECIKPASCLLTRLPCLCPSAKLFSLWGFCYDSPSAGMSPSSWGWSLAHSGSCCLREA